MLLFHWSKLAWFLRREISTVIDNLSVCLLLILWYMLYVPFAPSSSENKVKLAHTDTHLVLGMSESCWLQHQGLITTTNESLLRNGGRRENKTNYQKDAWHLSVIMSFWDCPFTVLILYTLIRKLWPMCSIVMMNFNNEIVQLRRCEASAWILATQGPDRL